MRTCSRCEKKGHDVRTCLMKKGTGPAPAPAAAAIASVKITGLEEALTAAEAYVEAWTKVVTSLRAVLKLAAS